MSGEQTVFIIDDDAPVRDSLMMLLEAHGMAVQGFASAAAFLEALQGGRHGCALVDVRMPGMTGLELQASLKARGIPLPLILMTGFAEVPIAVQAMKAGAVDFIEKPFDDDIIVAAVERALAVDRTSRPAVVGGGDALAKIGRLTEREREVFDLLALGEANKTVAQKLQISPRTVEVHRARIMEKIEARSLSDLVRLAIAAGGRGGH